MLIIFTAAAYSQSAPSFPRLLPDPKAIEYHQTGQSAYTWRQLAEIALWASGDTSLANLSRITAAVENMHLTSELPASTRERAEFILSYLHSNVFRSYSIYQTRIDTILANGLYNCVSSAVLYMIFCESASIRTSGVVTREHAFVIVHAGTEDIDVETTNRYGLDPGNRREFHDQFGRLTGFTYVPAHNYRDRQTISALELISLIMNNRIADLERAGRFSDAVPIGIDRAALLFGSSLSIDAFGQPDLPIFGDPRKDLADRLFNYGASLLRLNREEDALLWAAQASSIYPQERWEGFVLAAVNNRITNLLRGNRSEEARDFLENNRALITAADYAQMDTAVIDAELFRRANSIFSSAGGDCVIYDIRQAQTSGRLSERRANELLTFTILKTADIIARTPQGNWREAVSFLENAVSLYGTNRDIEQTLGIYMNNLAIDYHNRFAEQWNSRNYQEAQRILDEGLSEFPDDRQLLRDMETVERQGLR